jgi:hypothetical protein
MLIFRTFALKSPLFPEILKHLLVLGRHLLRPSRGERESRKDSSTENGWTKAIGHNPSMVSNVAGKSEDSLNFRRSRLLQNA